MVFLILSRARGHKFFCGGGEEVCRLARRAERLEQWRILENGFRIRVVETQHDSIGIDTPDDLARAEALLGTIHPQPG